MSVKNKSLEIHILQIEMCIELEIHLIRDYEVYLKFAICVCIIKLSLNKTQLIKHNHTHLSLFLLGNTTSFSSIIYSQHVYRVKISYGQMITLSNEIRKWIITLIKINHKLWDIFAKITYWIFLLMNISNIKSVTNMMTYVLTEI